MFGLLFIVFLSGYLLGSINTSIIVSRFYGVDIRSMGSGNAGATNTLRTLGKSAAIFVLAGDSLKGIISCLIGAYVLSRIDPSYYSYGAMISGLGAVIGHNWPLYFSFRGGKGVLTSAAVLFLVDWKAGIIALVLFIIIVAITKYVSLGSILAALSFPLYCILNKENNIYKIFFSLIISGLVVYRHRANIDRLIKGTESKLGSKNKNERNELN